MSFQIGEIEFFCEEDVGATEMCDNSVDIDCVRPHDKGDCAS